jgi:ELWxxDGT repeat protein
MKKHLYLYSMAFICLLLWCNAGKMYAQTALVKDIEPGTGSSTYSSYFVTMGTAAYFVANTTANSYELWKTDATTAGTTLVKDINPGTGNANPSSLFVNGATLYFLADNGTNGKELWKSDGTTAGTVLVRDIAAGTAQGVYSYSFFGSVGSTIFFQADAGTTGYELWKSDGTTAGTVLVKDVRAGATSGFSGTSYSATAGSTFFFTANDGTNGTELWKSDGTTAGTVMVKDIYTGSTSSDPQNFTVIGSTLYFTATTSANGVELWKSDGTTAGTVLVRDINAGAVSSSPMYFTTLGTNLFFRATTAANGIELWKSDGTTAGTVIVSDIYAGTQDGYPQNLTVFGGLLYFTATNAAAGQELWKTDGTAGGTVLVKDIYAGTTSSYPTLLTGAGSVMYFSASTAAAGNELWKSDGTTAGTVLVRDINSGTSGSSISNISYVLGTVYFNAYQTINGQSFGSEPWKTNGTSAGTLMIDDMQPLSNSSSPFNFLGLSSTVLFFASNPAAGYELFKITSGHIQKPHFASADTVLISGSASNYLADFLDQTPNDPTSWSWTFTGGSPGTSTTQNPVNIAYNTPGCYAVTLTTNFAAGSGTTTKTCYVKVTDINANYCIGHTPTSTTGGMYITNVKLGTINNSSGSASGPDFTSYIAQSTNICQLSTYKIYLQGVKTSTWKDYNAWIDYNKDGYFDASEQIGNTFASGSTPTVYTDTITFTVPSGTYIGSTRLRVEIDDDFGGGNPCYFSGSDGEVEDYTVIIGAPCGTPPVSNFSGNHTIIYTGASVDYTDLSGNSPTSWAWSFAGGSPATSTTQHPTYVYYNTPGVFNTTLTASNVFGPNSHTKTGYITVTASPAYCLPTTTSGGAAFISNFKLNGWTLWASGTSSGPYYYDQTTSGVMMDLTKSATYPIDFTSGSASLGNYAAWIDYNRDGDFVDAGEKLGQIQLLGGYATGSFNFTVPAGASTGQTRLRIMGNSGGPSTLVPCYATGSGSMVDLSVYILPSPSAPIADFIGSPLSIPVGGAVNFTDLSANTPTSWSWSFTGGTPSTSTTQNPTGITYPAAGCYQVSLTATNSIGSDAEVKTCYINVTSGGGSAPVANFSASATNISVGGNTNFTDLSTNTPTSWSWSFTGGTPATSTLQNPTGITYPTAGCYQVSLTATNAAGSDAEVKTCYINVTTGGTGSYCPVTTSTYGTTDGDFIDGVTLGTINNLNTGSATGPFYVDYTAMSTNLLLSSAQTISIKSGTWPATYPDYYAAWIDYNHDNDFVDAGEKLGEFLSTAPATTQSIAFTVPATATTGNTRMRVRGVWNSAAGIDPCLSYAYGETEDYSVNITTTSGGGGSACDTLQNFQNTNTIVLYTNTGGGYVCGHNSYLDVAKSEKFSTYTPGNRVKGAYLSFAKAKFSTAAKTVSVKIWDDNGAAGAPNTVLVTKTVTIASIAPDVTAGNETYVQFTTPVTVTGPFYLGIEFAYANGDTVALWSNSNGETTPGTAWEKFSDGTWHAMSESGSWGINISQLIRPLMCSPSTEMEDVYSGLNFNVYPNPNAGEFTIDINSTETTPVTYTIINSVGKEIMQKELRSVNGNVTEQINLGDFASGIYYVILRNGDNVINKKIIVQK